MENASRRDVGTVVLFVVLMGAGSMALADGIPEPGLTMYGAVKNDIGGARVRLTSGTLTLILAPPSGPPVALTTELRNINDQFSYLLEVPFETALPGSPPTANALQLQVNPTSYSRSDVTVDTNAAKIVSAETTFLFSQSDRASVERVDLDTSIAYPDQDGDGLPDFWEDDHFGGYASPTDDPDGDGLNNLKEYLSGCDPNDPGSAFLFVNAEPADTGGYTINWSSQEKRYYSVERSRNLLTGFAPLVSGLPATPPENSYTDPTATGEGSWFYRILID